MTLVLRWRKPAPTVPTRWRGPDGRVFAAAAAPTPRPIASVIGVPGPAGDSAIVRAAGSAVGGHRAVRVAIDGNVVHASPGDPEVEATIGVTTGAAGGGDNVTVRTGGEMTEAGWAWTPGGAIFLADDGVLTQVLPTTDAIFRIGTATAATRILIEPRLIARL